jgi:hypothetical protein
MTNSDGSGWQAWAAMPCSPDYKDAWKNSHDPHQAIFERCAGQAGSNAPATPLLLLCQLSISQG